MVASILNKDLHLSDENIALKKSIQDAIDQLEELQKEAESTQLNSYDHFYMIRRKIEIHREKLKAKIDTLAQKMIDLTYKKENVYKLKLSEIQSQLHDVDILSCRQTVLSEFRKPKLKINEIKRLQVEHELKIARF